ncbi:MAG: bifunctional phosphoribosyl-AMP cyclohydrolase/phosphoribosyl-ATP diphosphatase HisIE [Eubacterium sp.]
MSYFKLIPIIYIKDGKAVTKDGNVIYDNAAQLALLFGNRGADAIILSDLSQTDAEHEKNINCMKDVYDAGDTPFISGGNIKRLEDVKKYIYAGAKAALLNIENDSNKEIFAEAQERFGADKVLASFVHNNIRIIECGDRKIPIMEYSFEKAVDMAQKGMAGIACADFDIATDFMAIKHKLKNQGIKVNVFESALSFNDLKTNEDGMIPVVVQDYKTDKVLMLAYMNEEAFKLTLQTGRMTYYSRSRNEIWEKGLTSGCYQYVRELTMDCDKDTMLAKVLQVGVPCHTGADTCFFNNVVKKEYDDRNPLKVFEDVYNTIVDRKENPKDGSYTNYLFDKGIDKILKKVGEEATEIIIAAKNPDDREMIYEVSDFLYHVMVLMAEKGISWEDITKELARRH